MKKHILNENAIFAMIASRVAFNVSAVEINVFAEIKATYEKMWQHNPDLDRIFKSLRGHMFEYCQCVELNFLDRWEIEVENFAKKFRDKNLVFNSDKYYETLICLICGFFQCQIVSEPQYCGVLDAEGVEIEKHVFVHDWSKIENIQPTGYAHFDNLLNIFKVNVKNGYK